MNRQEIEAYVASKNSTVLDFPDRGPWGNNHYRGNCSGWIYQEIEGYRKCQSNPHWREKVRQTLQKGPFISSKRGVWTIAA